MDYSKYLYEIVNSLKELDIFKIILIGSYAKNNPREDSELDIVVILDEETISRTYKERFERKLKVRRKIYSISEIIPIDLIVYTKAEFKMINNQHTSFSNEIAATGHTLYEKAS